MFSEPATGRDFFGRQDVLELLNKRASALKDGYRQNVALTGQSLAGKSSIILHFLRNLRDEGFIPVYIEVVREAFRDFTEKFIATMLYNALAKLGHAVSMDPGELADTSAQVIPRTSAAVKRVRTLTEEGKYEEAYMGLLGLTSTLKDEATLPCIVILDEFDNLEHLGIKNPFLSFGKAIMVQKDTMYIVSSSRSEAIRKIISEKLSLLFGNFEVLKVSNFDHATSAAFLETALAGFDPDDGIKEFLISFTDGNPFYLRKMASRIAEIAAERMSTHIDTCLVARAIVDLVYNSGGAIHQYLMNFVSELLDTRLKDSYLATLVAICGGRAKTRDLGRILKTKQSEVSKRLSSLSELGVVSRNGSFYSIDDATFRFWLKFVYDRRKKMLVDGAIDKMDLFLKEAEGYLGGALKEFSRAPADRIAEIFGLFSNDLVQIDSKQLRLPYFTKTEVRSFAANPVCAYIAASFRGNFWIAQPYGYFLTENDVVNFMRNTKSLDCKISHKIIMPLKGIDENARLLAKELKISIWGIGTINTLMDLYGKRGIVVL